MAEVLDMPVEALERRRERPSERKEKEKPSDEPQIRKRDRDSRERRDDRDDRPHRRGDYHDRLRSPAMAGPPPREREYKRPRPSPSPPPYVPRDRRHSPPRRSPPYKRSRRDEMYDRRGSPRAGFNADDRRHMAELYWYRHMAEFSGTLIENFDSSDLYMRSSQI